MSKSITLSPAYGRDYRSQKAVREDFNANKDFIIEDWMNPWCGKPVSRNQLVDDGYTSVEMRYQRKTKVMIIKL